MSPPAFHVRRATIDDLPALLELWRRMDFPILELERRLTEFQLVESAERDLLGALGMEIIERQARLHSEAFVDFALADAMREKLWERMQSLAANRGLARIWHHEAVPFWKQNGFLSATPETLKKLPAPWASLSNEWLTLQLRDEEALQKSLDADFLLFKQEQQKDIQEVLARARFWKYVAVALSLGVAVVALIFTVYLLINNAARLHH